MAIKQPNSRMCFVCGLENPAGLKLAFYNTAADEVTAQVSLPAHYQGYPGIAHGGITAAMLDEAAGRTSMIADPNHFLVTASLDVRYRHPVPTGVPLRLIARRVCVRGRVVTAHAEIQLPDGTVAAEAEATLMDAPAPFLENIRPEEQLGWRMYPDAG